MRVPLGTSDFRDRAAPCCPLRIEVRESIPRTATGKVQKFKLRDQYWQGQARQVN